MNTISFSTAIARRYIDPLTSTDSDIRIEHHLLLCEAKGIPADIPTDPNPREQNIDRGIYKDVQKSLLDAQDLSFHLKNKGITIIAKSVTLDEKKERAIVEFEPGDGIVDGGHTYNILVKNLADCPEHQFVKFEILTGVPRYLVESIAQGLNTSVQVTKMSLDNLGKRFEWIKEILDKKVYGSKIAYKQNAEGDYTVRDIVSFLTLFNIDLFPEGMEYPKIAYTSKEECLKRYEKNTESYRKLAPILPDILDLSDQIQLRGRDLYNKKYAGRGGGLAFYQSRKRGKYQFVFSAEEAAYKLYDGALFPILGAFRYLVEEHEGAFRWKLGAYSKVLALLDKIGGDMINATKNTSDSRGKNPTLIGKDDSHWENLYKTVALAYLEGKLLGS